MVNNQIGAFFDFDETLLDTESSRLGIKYLWERRLVSGGFILKAFVAGTLYRRHIITDEQTAKILLRLYRNRRLAEFTEGSEGFYREILKPRLAPKRLRVGQGSIEKIGVEPGQEVELHLNGDVHILPIDVERSLQDGVVLIGQSQGIPVAAPAAVEIKAVK